MYNPHELYHHGILGQKWGVRRFQNKDGTLTAAGKKRKAKLEAEYESVTGKKIKSDLNPNSGNDGHEKLESIDDIRKQIDFLRAKNDLLDAQLANRKKYAELNPPAVNKGKEFAKAQGGKLLNSVLDVGIDVGKKWATNYLTEKFLPETEGEKLKRIADNMKYKSDIAKYQSDIKKYTSPQKEDKYELAKKEADYVENLKKKLANERQLEKLQSERDKKSKK